MKSFFRVGVMLFVFVLSMTFMSFFAEAADEARVINLTGNPKIMKAGQGEWKECPVNTVIDNGDRIMTRQNEMLDISFSADNSNVVHVAEKTDVFVKRNVSPYSIELLNGAAIAYLKNLPKDSNFEIRTPTGISGARGTAWRAETNGAKSTFGAFENSIYVKGIDASGREAQGELTVGSGWKTVVDKFERPVRLEKLTDKEINSWREWKENIEKIAPRSKESDKDGKGGPGGPGGPGSGGPKSRADLLGTTTDKTNLLARDGDGTIREPIRTLDNVDRPIDSRIADRTAAMIDQRINRIETTQENVIGTKEDRDVKRRERPPLPPHSVTGT